MTLNEVIQLGSRIEDYHNIGSSVAVVLLLIVIGILLLCLSDITPNTRRVMTLTTVAGLFFVGLVIYLIMDFIDVQEAREIYLKDVKEWKQEAVEPYLTTLDRHEKELVEVDLDDDYLVVGYISHGKVKRLTGDFELKKDLNTDEGLYAEYVYLQKDLGHDVTKGWYNVVVHVPRNYKF